MSAAADPLKLVRGLRELVESEADAIDQASTMTPKVVDALADANLFRLIGPKDLGGMEADVETIFDVFEELSFADGSVGWAFAQNTTVTAYSAYLSVEYGQELVDARAAAGMFAPLGAGREVNGGFQLAGSYKFGSGSGHAEYMGGCAVVQRAGDAPPEVRAFIIPADRVVMKGNWDVMGLRGTGSFDYDVPEQFVEEGRTFAVFTAPVVTGGAIYGIGAIALGTISSTAWALGVASRAMHEIAEVGRGGRMRMGAGPLLEQPIFQRDYGIHLAAIKAARLFAKEAYGNAVEAAGRGAAGAALSEYIVETHAAANYAVRISKAATTFAYEWAGSHGLRNPSLLQRCFRDIQVGSVHQVFDDRNYGEYTRKTLGLDAG